MSGSTAKVFNLLTGRFYVDTLHKKAIDHVPCNTERCMGSLMSMQAHRPPGARRTREELFVHATDFLEQFYKSIKKVDTPAHFERLAEVKKCIDRMGTYDLTNAELVFGAKQGWRNAPRCIGRIQWSKLQVFDCRNILTARAMFEAICIHIKYSTHDGVLRSAITIFPQRRESRGDFRVWNSQIIRYAGYKMDNGKIIGDPATIIFTKQCIKLGWTPKYGMFDVLPIVVSAAGADPEWFEIPPEIILEVELRHPNYPWFADFKLKWFAVPGVSSMLLDCGGLEFTACPFNGWYMGTELGRDLGDSNRYNLLEPIALKMGLDTQTNSTLWKDKALVEINLAVIYSFQANGVTISDHHSASESFIKHMENEQKLRGGCPGDWVWIVPPMSGSIVEVFHQEMLLYKLKPSYEYQDDAWKTHVWKHAKSKTRAPSLAKGLLRFKQVASTVKYNEKLNAMAQARKVKCTIVFATETGKSEKFAKMLSTIFNDTFNVEVLCMEDYDVTSLEHESLVLAVTSTFGNGEPPENGEAFSKGLFQMTPGAIIKKRTSRANSIDVRKSAPVIHIPTKQHRDSLVMQTGPLSNVRFSVFALGSKAYPHFAAFGSYIDKILGDLGAERIFPIGVGDELSGQEKSFMTWAEEVFKKACEIFCVGNSGQLNEVFLSIKNKDNNWSSNKYRITYVDSGTRTDAEICQALSKLHHKKVMPCILKERIQLRAPESDRQTILVKLDTQSASELTYSPGDHVGIFPANNPDMVNSLLSRLDRAPHPDQLICTEVLTETFTPLGIKKVWTQIENVPVTSLRTAFTYFLDITSPPSQALLQELATQAEDEYEKNKLELLATDPEMYNDWNNKMSPNLLEVLDQFTSLEVDPTLLLSQLPPLQQRYYSVSSSPEACPGEIHATIAVVKTRVGSGVVHEGVCSCWLNRCLPGTVVPCFTRVAANFHLPVDQSAPIIMVGTGAGIAPFRSFWQQRMVDIKKLNLSPDEVGKHFGDMVLYFGCRKSQLDNIYSSELKEMENAGALTNVYVAFSREENSPKVYVQDILLSHETPVFDVIVREEGHFYVCGDVSMSEDVTRTVEIILQQEGQLLDNEVAEFMTDLMKSERYHEDVFGVRKTDQPRRSNDEKKGGLIYLTPNVSRMAALNMTPSSAV